MCQTGNVRAQRLDARKFRPLAIGLQQGRKHVGCAQRDLGNRSRGRVLQRQHVLELMGQFADLPETAGGRVPLQGVHRPPQAAGGLRIAGRFLQLHRLVVQLLDEFPSAFKEQLAEFYHPIVGGNSHTFTSTRWYAVPLL